MCHSRSILVLAMSVLLAVAGSNPLLAANQQIFQRQQGPELLIQPDIQVDPTGGTVLPYMCDSQKNVCTCRGVLDCDVMKTDRVCAKDNVCDDYGCTCTWRNVSD
jgi:hypothetical protein